MWFILERYFPRRVTRGPIIVIIVSIVRGDVLVRNTICHSQCTCLPIMVIAIIL